MGDYDISYENCPPSAAFFGFMGVSSALIFANIGAAYGTAKSGVGISSMGVMNPNLGKSPWRICSERAIVICIRHAAHLHLLAYHPLLTPLFAL
jgi:hypothetical protein